jgi:alkaline phosphatase D
LTLLGAEQENWLANAMTKSTARWNVIAQQTLMAQSDRDPLWGQRFWTDGWDGYPKARERLLNAVAGSKLSNPLVLGGDVHTAIVADLKLDFNDAKAPAMATEFLGPSITSRGPSPKALEAVRHKNPHFKWANPSERGYASFEMTTARCVARMRAVSSVSRPDANLRNLATFVVENGKPGAQPL